MRFNSFPIASLKIAAVAVVGGLSLSACATREYVDEQIALVGTRITAAEQAAQAAAQRAQAAAAAAEAANGVAQAAAADARTANQRIEQMSGRMTTLEQAGANRAPRN